MAKKTYYKRYRGSRDKYSVEQTAGQLNVPAAQQAYVQVVPDSSIGGMRKVKHLSVNFASPDTLGSDTVGYWALVYCPQGTTPSQLNLTGSSMYEPNQYVMNCGTFDCNAGPVRFHSPVSRNLNSGDKVYLIVANPNSTAQGVFLYTVRYAITLQ